MWRTFYMLGYKVVAKVYEQGSVYGMKEIPRISKMSITKHGKELFHYERGLDFSDLNPFIFQVIIRMLKWVL